MDEPLQLQHQPEVLATPEEPPPIYPAQTDVVLDQYQPDPTPAFADNTIRPPLTPGTNNTRILRARNASHDVSPPSPAPQTATRIRDGQSDPVSQPEVNTGTTKGRAGRHTSTQQSKRKSSLPRKLKIVLKKGVKVKQTDGELGDLKQEVADGSDLAAANTISDAATKKRRGRQPRRVPPPPAQIKREEISGSDDDDDDVTEEGELDEDDSSSDSDYVMMGAASGRGETAGDDAGAPTSPNRGGRNRGRGGRAGSSTSGTPTANGSSMLAPNRRRRRSDKVSCEICGRFYHKRYIGTHMLKHSGDKPHACPLCQKRFVSKRSIAMHIQKRHEGPEAQEREMYKQCALKKRFPCTICDKTFTRKTKLKDHINFHLGLSRHLCDHCGKMLLSRKTLRTHLLIHAELKPYSCHVCGKSFRQQPVLKRHLTTHTGIKPFLCDACGKQFIHRVYLLRHKCPKAKQLAEQALMSINNDLLVIDVPIGEEEDDEEEEGLVESGVGESHHHHHHHRQQHSHHHMQHHMQQQHHHHHQVQHFMGLEDGIEPEIT